MPLGGDTVAIARVLTHGRIKDAVRYDLASDFDGSEKLANDEYSSFDKGLADSATVRGSHYGWIARV